MTSLGRILDDFKQRRNLDAYLGATRTAGWFPRAGRDDSASRFEVDALRDKLLALLATLRGGPGAGR